MAQLNFQASGKEAIAEWWQGAYRLPRPLRASEDSAGRPNAKGSDRPVSHWFLVLFFPQKEWLLWWIFGAMLEMFIEIDWRKFAVCLKIRTPKYPNYMEMGFIS